MRNGLVNKWAKRTRGAHCVTYQRHVSHAGAIRAVYSDVNFYGDVDFENNMAGGEYSARGQGHAARVREVSRDFLGNSLWKPSYGPMTRLGLPLHQGCRLILSRAWSGDVPFFWFREARTWYLDTIL